MGERKLELRTAPKSVTPIFADEVLVGITIKAAKRGEEVRKEGVIRLAFIDIMRSQVLAEFVILPETARSLHKVLGETLKRFSEEMARKEMPKPKRAEGPSTSYVG